MVNYANKNEGEILQPLVSVFFNQFPKQGILSMVTDGQISNIKEISHLLLDPTQVFVNQISWIGKTEVKSVLQMLFLESLSKTPYDIWFQTKYAEGI